MPPEENMESEDQQMITSSESSRHEFKHDENGDKEDVGLLNCDKNEHDSKNTTRPPNPLSQASLLSKSFFRWPFSLLKLGMERSLEEHDLPHIMEQESSVHNRNLFEKVWNDELERVEKYNSTNKKKIKPMLHRALLMDFIKSTWIIQPIMCASAISRVVMAIAIGNLTQAFIAKDGMEGYLWAGILVLCNIIVLMEHHHVFFITGRKGMNMRTAAVAAIFSKSLRLSSIGISHGSDTTTHITSGQIMNLVSNDVERFFHACLFISYVVWAPLQTIGVLIIGIKLIGSVFVVGMGLLMFIFVPIQVYLSKKFASVRSKVSYEFVKALLRRTVADFIKAIVTINIISCKYYFQL